MIKRIVTVQDISCIGQCSITAALPVLSTLGVETALLPSAILSTHTGGFTGVKVHDLTEVMPGIVEHWKAERLSFDAVYTGYIGDERQFNTIRALKELLAKDGLMIVDPAMADHGRIYSGLNERIVRGMMEFAAEADVILPNLTEAALLLGREYREDRDLEEIREMAHALTELGPRIAVITGVSFAEGRIGAACYDRAADEFFVCGTERIGRGMHGTGDLFASVVTGKLVTGCGMKEAVQAACEFVAAAIRVTVDDPDHFYGTHFESALPLLRK